MPGLRIHRCLRPPFISRVRIGPSWAKVPLDLALALTATRLALTRPVRRRALARRRRRASASCSPAGSRVPHLYDMHSSLPQQVAQLRLRARRRGSTRMLGWLERLMIRRSRVVIVICQDLETTVRGIDADVPTVLIENAPGSGDAPAAGTGARDSRGARARGRRRPSCSTRARSSTIRGSTCCTRAMAVVVRAAPGRAARAGRRRAGAGRGRARGRSTRWASPSAVDLHRPASRRGDSGLSRRRDRARVAAIDRHEHAAEDLPVPAIGPADRRDQPAHAHAGARRRDRVSRRSARPRRLARRFSRRSTIPARGRRSARARASSPRRKYSDEAFIAKTRHGACGLLRRRTARRARRP